MEQDLYEYAIERLPSLQGSWPEIARECDVSYSWLCKFASKKIQGASYNRVKRLANCIAARSTDPKS